MFINMPSGIILHDPNPGPNRGIKVNKALYGMKQSPRLWFQDIKKCLIGAGLTFNKREPTLFMHETGNGITYVLVYVDDIIITGPTKADIDWVHSKLKEKYTIGSYERLHSYLGMNVHRPDPTGPLTIDMSARIDDITSEFPAEVAPLTAGRTVPRPSSALWTNVELDRLSLNEAYCLNHYRHFVGAINYLCTCYRIDIALALSKLAAHNSDPKPEHAKYLYHLTRYLLTTKHHALAFNKRSSRLTPLETYSDSNFADMLEIQARATSGTIVTYRGCPIQWKSKRQPTPTASTHHAELLALYQSTKLALEFRYLLEVMKLGYKTPDPIFVDNEAVSFSASAEVIASKNRHIKTKYFLIMDHINTELVVPWLPGTDNPADLLTKPLPHEVSSKHSNALLYGAPRPSPSPCGGVYEPVLGTDPIYPTHSALEPLGG